MSQQDFDITTADANTGLTFRAAVNAALQALASCSSGATEPATKYAYQLWFDTTAGRLKIRNSTNTAWIALLDATTGLTVSNAELNHVDGVTSAIQAQLDGKVTTDSTASLAKVRINADVSGVLNEWVDSYGDPVVGPVINSNGLTMPNAPTAGASTLDYYLETAVTTGLHAFFGGTEVTSYLDRVCRCTFIGNVGFYTGYVAINVKGAGTGTFNITGFPTGNIAAGLFSNWTVICSGLTGVTGETIVGKFGDTGILTLARVKDGIEIGAITNAQVSAGASIVFSGMHI